jgi:hypothetical protein
VLAVSPGVWLQLRTRSTESPEIRSCSARLCGAFGVREPVALSNTVSVPSGRSRASCCQAKPAPRPNVKSLCWPPIRQTTAPVRRSIS